MSTQEDVQSIVKRIKNTLAPWFGNNTPVLDAILLGPATAFTFNNQQYIYAKLQERIQTSTDIYLDLYGKDFFGKDLQRCKNQNDNKYRNVLMQNQHIERNSLIRQKVTRQAMFDMIKEATGYDPVIFVPGEDGFFLDHSFLDHDSLSFREPYTVYITVTMPPHPRPSNLPFYLDDTMFLTDNAYFDNDPDDTGLCISQQKIASMIGADETHPIDLTPVPYSVLQTKPIGIKAIVYFINP